jgi:hypothetical protein
MRHALLLLATALCMTAVPAHAIVGGTDTSSFGQVASGVQIAPNWVLTARHLTYTVGSSYSNGYGSASVAAVYDAGAGSYPFADLTLLRLDTAINAPAIELNASALPGGTGYAIDATIVTGHNQVPRGYAFTTVREFQSLIDPDGDGPLGPVEANYLITYPTGYGAPYVEGGDSGGALFLGHVLDANAPLWGISSAQIYDEDEQGNKSDFASGFVQVASYRSWIDSTMMADTTDAELASWTVTGVVPEPGTWALLAIGLMGLRLRRARRAASAAQQPRKPPSRSTPSTWCGLGNARRAPSAPSHSRRPAPALPPMLGEPRPAGCDAARNTR